MSDSNHIHNIAIVGASGNVGQPTLKHLLEQGSRFNITVITRPDSTSSLPDTVTVKKGSYTDPSFLQEAFSNQDAAIFALNYMATNDQPKLIEAAAKAGVEWILPNEYSGDGMNDELMENVPIYHSKRAARQQIEELGMNWVGVCTGPFLEFSIKIPMLFGISVSAKKVTTWEKLGRFNVTTLDRIGQSIANLLALPITNSSNPRASLEYYAKNFLYTSSFYTTQSEILASVQRATSTTSSDWTTETQPPRYGEGLRKKKEGVLAMQNADLLFGGYMSEGAGGDVEEKSRVDREVLGLPHDEDLDACVREVVDGIGDLPAHAPK